MDKNILVFAGKWVGFELLKYLLEMNAPVDRVIVSNINDKEILELLSSKDVPFEIFAAQTQFQLVNDGHRYEWLLNLWSPHILFTPILNSAAHRLNVHPSLVPHCKGNDNAAWTIRLGVPAGVSLLEIREGVDQGEVYIQKEVPYSFPIRGSELHALLQKELVKLFRENWPAIYAREIIPYVQSGEGSYYTRKQTEQDRLLDSSMVLSLEEFLRWGYAHDFSPGTTAEFKYQRRIYKLKISVQEK